MLVFVILCWSYRLAGTGSIQDVKDRWPPALYAKLFSKTENSYLYKGPNKHILDINFTYKDMKGIDSFLLRRIHTYEKLGVDFTWGFGQDMKTCYLYSIDEPLNGYYPVSILQHQKFGTLYLTTYIFDKEGKIVSSFHSGHRWEIGQKMLRDSITPTGAKVWDLGPHYCHIMYSERINDSTLMQVKAVSWKDSLQVREKQPLTVSKSGKVSGPGFY